MPFIPAGTSSATYTDWEAIKVAHAAEDLTGTDDRPQLEQVFERADADLGLRDQVLDSLSYESHVELFGWEFPDLTWELKLSRWNQSVHVLSFSAAFDIAALKDRFSQCGHERSELRDALLFSAERPPDTCLQDDFGYLTDSALANAALLLDRRILLVSVDAAELDSVLDGFRRGQGRDPIVAELRQLARGGQFSLLDGRLWCSPGDLSEGPLERYRFMFEIVGYVEREPEGELVFVFDTAAAARRDLVARGKLLERTAMRTGAFALRGSDLTRKATAYALGPGDGSLDLTKLIIEGQRAFVGC